MLGNMNYELQKARYEHYAIPAFNALNPWMIKNYIDLASDMRVPVIIAIAEAHLPYISLEESLAAYEYYANQTDTPVMLHLDHGQNINIVVKAIDLGFKSVMFDGSMLCIKDNISLTRQVVDYAKRNNVCVEAEIGHVGSGKSYETKVQNDSIYTTVSDAKIFVEKTNIDSLAVSIGTAHGLYKGTPSINFNRLVDIYNTIDIPLVLHGGSSSGDENLSKAVQLGISKVNICTDIIISMQKYAKNVDDYLELQELLKAGLDSCCRHYINLFYK